MQFPEEAESIRDNVDQFMVGSEMLVAPVLNKGETSRKVFLPKGIWTHVWRDTEHGSATEGTWIHVEAPIGEPAVFVTKNYLTKFGNALK